MHDNDFGLIALESPRMAKKKAVPRSAQKIIISYKADPQTYDAYKAWLDELADHIGVPVTIALDMAVKVLAEKHKFRPPPKRLAR